LKYIALYVLIIGSLFGASDEFHQYFIPNRQVELEDWIADTIGVAISLFFMNFVKQFVSHILKDFE
jgi:VanZ family protein